MSRGAFAGPGQQRRQVERVPRRVSGVALAEQLDVAHGLVERAQAERREQATHLLGDEEQIGLHHLRRPGELGAQLGALRRDPDRARVEVTRAHHQAALGQQERGAERELVRAEQRRDDDVAARLEAAVDA
jgi:hypothetical protein